MHETRPPEPTIRWRKVSIEDIDVYIPWNAPIEALGQTLAFGQVESAGGRMTTDFEGEGAGDSDDNRVGEDGGVDGTTSGGGVHLRRVNAALLAAGSQHMRWNRRN